MIQCNRCKYDESELNVKIRWCGTEYLCANCENQEALNEQFAENIKRAKEIEADQ